MFDNRGAHCACAALRARPSPAPPERTRRPGARRSRAHAALRGRWDTRPGKWAVRRGLATRRRRGGRALRAGLLPQRPPPLVFIFLELGSFLPPSLPFAVRGKASEGARGHLESLLFFAACYHWQPGGDSPALAGSLEFAPPRLFAARFLFMLCRWEF